MENIISLPTKAVLCLDKKFNVISCEEEFTEVEMNPNLGKFLLRMLGTTPEDVLETMIHQTEENHNEQCVREHL